jgi:hypothetical protein
MSKKIKHSAKNSANSNLIEFMRPLRSSGTKTPLNAGQAHLSPCPDTGINITMPESKGMQDIRLALGVLDQTHTALSEFIQVIVCENRMTAISAFCDLNNIKADIDSACKILEKHPEDSPFYPVYEECDLAEGFLTCLLVTLWNDDHLPAPQPLDWREAMVTYAVVYSTMHRLGKALDALKRCIRVEFGHA